MTGVSMMIYWKLVDYREVIENGRASEVKKGHFFIPVIAHNMKGYDSHIIMKHLTKQFPDKQIQVIAHYITLHYITLSAFQNATYT